MSKYIKLYRTLIENNPKIYTLFDIAKIDYTMLYDKNNKSYLYVKCCDVEKVSENIFYKIMESLRELKVPLIENTIGSRIFLTHEISIIDGVSLDEVDYFSIGIKFAQLTLKNGKFRRAIHSPLHPYILKDSKLMQDKISNKVYVVSQYNSGD